MAAVGLRPEGSGGDCRILEAGRTPEAYDKIVTKQRAVSKEVHYHSGVLLRRKRNRGVHKSRRRTSETPFTCKRKPFEMSESLYCESFRRS